MTIKYITLLGAMMALSLQTYAQFTADALRFSQIDQSSSARFKGIGGAQTAVGGDMSSLSGNPAGIGLFTRSEFSLTPELNSYSDKATYFNNESIGKKDRLNLSQIGVVFRAPTYRRAGQDTENGWLSVNFGIGFNRSHDLGNSFTFGGVNPSSSITDFYADQANLSGLNPSALIDDYNDFGDNAVAAGAYENYLIGYDSQDGYYPEPDLNSMQRLTDNRKGSQNEFNFAVGANYSNKLYIGASLALTSLNYRSESIFTESGYNPFQENDYRTNFTQIQDTKGSGVNGKLGVIYKAAPFLRIGASYQTPTWYTIDDDYSHEMSTQFGASRIDSQFFSPQEVYSSSYKVRTPSRINTGLVLLSKFGFISTDVEFVNYGGINFTSATGDDLNEVRDDNNIVRDRYANAINYRIGAEVKLDNIYARGGFGQLGNPYKDKENENYQNTTISGGLGYRVSNYFIDLTYQNISYKTSYTPYSVDGIDSPVASTKSNTSNMFLTFGVRF
ncbi:OmpP1/FadL family transporter [Desertivirga xinjiangensis]|uniref:OmpP1/FadL family transporter n=1 Tax=Desertivirga xinjiangensis TaxID=539206 RepID=UPI00210BA398|nr:hypothetical protein [Pedobacter xinjiangensis]